MHLTTPARQHPVSNPAERVGMDVALLIEAADTTEGKEETMADSENEVCVTSATLERLLNDFVEMNGASFTNSQKSPANAPQ
ncbi:hypothetical protein MRX96_001603 [Rhipicephalus microplus]